MLTVTRLAASLLLLFSVNLSLLAQERATESRSIPIVTATATAGKVRYVSMGEVQQTRLQVFSSDGIPIFDSSYKDGNLLDWQLTDQQGARVKDGSYLFLVTVKDFSGRTTQKYGTTIVEREQVYLEQTQRASLSQAQTTALEASKESETLSPVDRMGAAELNRTASVPATTGIAATANQSASKPEQSGTNPTSTTNPSAEAIGGTGSQNSITKWTDNTGTLGDSSIYETNGKIGIGTTTPREGLTVYSPGGTAKYIMSEWGGGGSVSFGGDNSNGPFLLSHTDSEGKATGNYTASRIRFGASGFLFDTSPVTPVGETRSWLTRAILDASGRFGLGIDTPTEKLDVVGNVKIRGIGNGIVFPDGTVLTSASGSGSMTGSSIISAINDPATTGTINDNRLSSNVARLNSGNAFVGNQSVDGKLLVDDLSNSGLRVITRTAGGSVAWFGNRGDFKIDSSNNGLGGRFIVKENGDVGIGATNPATKLDVNGTIRSSTGGFQFPDGTVQTTAIGKTYTNWPWATPQSTIEIAPRSSNALTILRLDVPAGTYLITATVELNNTANIFASDNTRNVECIVASEGIWRARLAPAGNGGDKTIITVHSVQTLFGNVPITVACGATNGGTDRSYVFAEARRLTAVKIGDLTTQP